MKSAYQLSLENKAVLAPLMNGVSEWDRSQMAEDIIDGLGSKRRTRMGGDQWWTLFKPDPAVITAATPLLSQYLGQKGALSTTNKDQLAALQAMMAKTKGSDPAAYSAYLAQYQALQQPWYIQYKWPLAAGAITLGIVALVFVAKKKSFKMSPSGSVSVKA
jgi:hypothetical protein